MSPPARRIRALDATTIDQIAAGEVVERPASVVKELVENALDSGAGAVEVTVEQGGLACISVMDDGCGMAADEVELAVMRHATSKIASVHDLQAVASYGFRGEALSSVASVSRLTLTTRRPEDDVGTRIELHGGEVVARGPCGCPPGTLLEVRELFYNVPARRKFMRAPATEQAYVHDALLRCALGARRGAFRYSAGRRRLLDVPHNTPPPRRPELLLGRRVRRLAAFAAEASCPGAVGAGVVLSGHLSPPLFDRAGTGGLWLFVNGRFVRDRMLQRAVLEGYQLAFPDQFVAAVVYLDVPPEQVDVNVHPQKLEVRFEDAQATFRAVREGVAVWAAKLRAAEQAEKRRGVGLPGLGGTATAGESAPSATMSAPRAELASPGGADATNDARGVGADVDAAADADSRAASLPDARAGLAAAAVRVAAAARRSFDAPPRVAARALRAPNTRGAPSAAVLRPRPATTPTPQALPLRPGVWASLTPLGLAPRGYLACHSDGRLVLVHLAAAYRTWAERTLHGAAGRAPALHRLLLPPSFAPPPDLAAAVAALVAEADEAASGGALGVHLQPLADGRYLVQAVPSPLADCAPDAVVLALASATASSPPSATTSQRLDAWFAALDAADAWPRTYGEGARWPARLFAALDAGPEPVAMQAPIARVLTSEGCAAAAPAGS